MLKFSQKIIIQFKRYRFGYPKELGKKIISIPNPVILPALKAKLDVSKKKYHLLFVGRLTYQKNVQSLIKAFLVLQQNHKHKNWILDIVGDGEDKKETPQKPKEDQGKPKERKSQLSPQQIKNLLDAMQNAEKKSQEKLEGKKVKGAPVKTKKDW